MTDRPPELADADARAVRRASRAVGLQITITSSLLVLAVLVAALFFVFEHIPPAKLFDLKRPHETTIDVGGIDILVAGLTIGVIAVILAGTMSWFATRRAVKPLGDALRIQRAFVADASHELRTPLAVLDARLQVLQRGLKPGDASAEIVGELRRDAKTLVEIVNDLLAAAEVGDQDEAKEPVAVEPVVLLAVESMRIIAADRSVSITVEHSKPLSTRVPAASLHRCMVALLDNALDFSPEASVIAVTIEQVGDRVRIAVRDHGPGITGIDPTRVFDRFARSSGAVDGGGNSHSGFGIGLSLVRDTVERAGGTARVSHSATDGTEIEMLVPVARTA